MEIKPDRFAQQIASEALKPVYLIAGSEPLIVQECADALRAKAREQGYSEREVIDADKDFDWDELAMGLASLSLFATRRLFDLRLPSGKPGKDGGEALRKYCDNPPPDTVLMITAQDWSRNHAGKWSESITKVGHFVPVWPVKLHELNDWLLRRLRSRGLGATPEAAALLAERVEGNLLAAAQEVDKLSLLLGSGDAPPANARAGTLITAEEMLRLVADSSRYDVFKLADAALSGEASRCVRMLAALRAEGDQVAGLLPIIAKELLQVATLSRVHASGGNVMNAMREARIWDNKQAMYRRAVDRHPCGRWEAFVGEAGRIDRMAKGREAGDAWLALERLLLAISDAKARVLLA